MWRTRWINWENEAIDADAVTLVAPRMWIPHFLRESSVWKFKPLNPVLQNPRPWLRDLWCDRLLTDAHREILRRDYRNEKTPYCEIILFSVSNSVTVREISTYNSGDLRDSNGNKCIANANRPCNCSVLCLYPKRSPCSSALLFRHDVVWQRWQRAPC